jgi:hypothetical protein
MRTISTVIILAIISSIPATAQDPADSPNTYPPAWNPAEVVTIRGATIAQLGDPMHDPSVPAEYDIFLLPGQALVVNGHVVVPPYLKKRQFDEYLSRFKWPRPDVYEAPQSASTAKE